MLDNFIIISFLIVTFITGIRHAKGIKTIKDYALGGRNFSTAAIVATLVATWVSGSFFAITLSDTYSKGLYDLLPTICMSFHLLITAFLLIPRMGEFLGNTSIAESMGNLYGNKIRIITAIAGIAKSVGFIAIQFKVFGSLFSYFLGLSSMNAIILAAAIVIIYSAFGGIKSVTFTDVIQAFTFSIAIPIIGVVMWNKFYYADFSFANSLAEPKFNFNKVFDLQNPKLYEMIPLVLYYSIPGLSPVFCQRILIGSTVKQAQKAFIISAIIAVIFLLVFAWIPFLIFNIDANLEPSQLLAYVIDNYTYTGIRGLLVAGIVAMAMSTADSYINSCAVLFSNDICSPLNLGKNKELLISKIFTFLLGGLGIMLALVEQDLLSMVLIADSFYMPIVTIPLIFSILGFRSSTTSVLVGMGTGFLTIVAWKLFKLPANGIVCAMFINLTFLMGSHYLFKQPGGWIAIRTKTNVTKKNKTIIKNFKDKLYNFNFIAYCKKYFPTNETGQFKSHNQRLQITLE